ncbi:sulfite reductase [Holotrichia oblita]|uniref:Sulfite reductase n=1 Tax=Holotrichia oblita TaxID=644536 RepID=A0ACB9SV17_HOLOL|nr:sulfite reductase [Holotrichia oblita]
MLLNETIFPLGNVSEEVSKHALADMTDPYAHDPKRHKVLYVHTEKPFNGEPPAGLLIEQFYTPNDIFYVRNHLPVPEVDLETYELEVEIENIDKIKKLNFADILKLPKYTVSATLMCAGNRRSEMNKVKEVKGLNWGASSIGNATWTGVRLVDVLKLIGVDDNTKEYSHVHFEGLDRDTASNLYTVSIPLSKAVNKDGDVLLAYEMNGQPISRDHGFPIRVIVPGTVGARNVKWLGRILIAKDECQSHWQQKDYKGVPPSADPSRINLSKLASIQDLPVISAICKPSNEEVVKVENGFITVKGYAWSGGGRKIIRVDLTTDGGKEWHVANFDHQIDHESPRHWSWTLWTAKVPVSKGQKTVEVWAKAIDSSYNSQPDTIDNIWNYRGFLNNAYHRIRVNLTF